jgi:hypothetical protein
MWLPAAIAWVMVIQFLTLIPVALALRGWLPRARTVRLATAAAVSTMLAVALLQLLLVTGALEFDVQVVLVMAAFLLVSTWVLTLSSTGPGHGTLPRPVSRFGLVLGVSYPVGLAIAAAGLLFPSGSAAWLPRSPLVADPRSAPANAEPRHANRGVGPATRRITSGSRDRQPPVPCSMPPHAFGHSR